MKLTDYISSTIDRLPKGFVFTYADFLMEVSQKEAIIKALNRMVGSGKIAKLAKGKYYKPESTPFGHLQPNQGQVVKDLLEENGKITGYLTGYSLYNQLGLTSQVSNSIQIGKNEVRPTFQRDQYRISFVKQKNGITKENIPLLQLLDAIRYIKKIPDTSIEASCRRILVLIADLSTKNMTTLIRLALKYPPATRALLGAMLEQINPGISTRLLFESLNPITKYSFSGASKVLSTTEKWNIV